MPSVAKPSGAKISARELEAENISRRGDFDVRRRDGRARRVRQLQAVTKLV